MSDVFTPIRLADPVTDAVTDIGRGWVDYGAAHGHPMQAELATAMMYLWFARSPAAVGKALAAPDVAPLVLELLPPPVLSLILTAWREHNAADFGAILAQALTGVAPKGLRDRQGRK